MTVRQNSQPRSDANRAYRIRDDRNVGEQSALVFVDDFVTEIARAERLRGMVR
jgi:hypothetical protein